MSVDYEAKKLMKEIEDNSQMSMDDIMHIAEVIQYSDLSDENTVRQLVRQLARMANRPISADKENYIVQSIINQDVPTTIDELQRYFK